MRQAAGLARAIVPCASATMIASTAAARIVVDNVSSSNVISMTFPFLISNLPNARQSEQEPIDIAQQVSRAVWQVLRWEK